MGPLGPEPLNPWFSFVHTPPGSGHGTLKEFLEERRPLPELNPEIRVTEPGKAELVAGKVAKPAMSHKKATRKAKPTDQRSRRKRKKREYPTIEMARAYEARESGLTLREIAKELGKSPTTISKWVEFVRRHNRRPRSVATQALPTNRRGQPDV